MYILYKYIYIVSSICLNVLSLSSLLIDPSLSLSLPCSETYKKESETIEAYQQISGFYKNLEKHHEMQALLRKEVGAK